MIKVKRITLDRAEGPIDRCGKAFARDYSEANAMLHSWASTAPKEGGYDKCDFEIEFEDGQLYQGRYDLVHWSVKSPSLQRHVQDFLTFLAGTRRPLHMKQEDYDRYLSTLGTEKESAAEFLKTYDVGQ